MVQLQYLIMAIGALMPHVIAQSCANINPSAAPTWGSGHTGRVVMNGLKTPRGLVFDSAGNLLVVETGRAGVRWIKLKDNGGTDVCVDTSKQLISDTTLNHGIDLSADGKTLFVTSNTNVYAYSYDAAAGTVGTKQTIINGIGNSGTHPTRTVIASKKAPDILMVQRGSGGNDDQTTSDVASGKSQIRMFNISSVLKTAAEYTSGQVLAWGLRNSVGFSEHPVTGGIWSVDNGGDDMTRNGKDIHQTNPCEELNYHGIITDASSKERGQNYGYPDCFSAWDPTVLPNNAGIKVGTPFLKGDASGGKSDAVCQQKMAPRLCFSSHTAPLDIRVNSNGTTAYISFHGSWDKQPPDGFRLSKINMDPATGMPKDPADSNTAEIKIMYNSNNGNCPNRCFRPVGLAFDSKGRLYMTSDTTNELWIIGGTA